MVNPPHTTRLTGISDAHINLFNERPNLTIRSFVGGSSKMKFRFSKPCDPGLIGGSSLGAHVSDTGASIMCSRERVSRLIVTGTCSSGNPGASLIFSESSETRNLVCFLKKYCKDQMRAVVKEPGPGARVVFPDGQAPKNSNDLLASATAVVQYQSLTGGTPFDE